MPEEEKKGGSPGSPAGSKGGPGPGSHSSSPYPYGPGSRKGSTAGPNESGVTVSKKSSKGLVDVFESSTTKTEMDKSGTRKSSKGIQAASDEAPYEDTFKVVQMTSDPCNPCNNGVIGYVYTYKVRHRHRIIKKGMAPSQPYQVVVVSDAQVGAGAGTMGNTASQKIQKAKDDMAYADELMEKAIMCKQLAEKRKAAAEMLQFQEGYATESGAGNDVGGGGGGGGGGGASGSGLLKKLFG